MEEKSLETNKGQAAGAVLKNRINGGAPQAIKTAFIMEFVPVEPTKEK